MKILKKSNGKKTIIISKREWTKLGQNAGWNDENENEQVSVDLTQSTSENKSISDTIKNNPLNGKSKQSAKNFIYNNVSHLTKGIFVDNAWEHVHAIFKKMDELGVSSDIESTQYYKDERGNPSGKIWSISIPFINNKGREDQLLGSITAAGAGTVEDPLSRYDLTLVVN
jgi:hypothetical protein